MWVIVYVLLAACVGWIGRNKQIGFVGFFILSLVVTPLVTLFVLMIAEDRRPPLAS